MNRRKSYRVLTGILLLAFVSLLTRSLIYLAISLTVAVLIIVLLSRDLQAGKEIYKVNTGDGPKTDLPSGKNPLSFLFPLLFVCVGALFAAVGFTGYFNIEGVFLDTGWMIDGPIVLILLVLTGIFLLIYGMWTLLKIWLS